MDNGYSLHTDSMKIFEGHERSHVASKDSRKDFHLKCILCLCVSCAWSDICKVVCFRCGPLWWK